MKRSAGVAIFVWMWLVVAAPAMADQSSGPADAGIARLLQALQNAAATGQPAAYLQLVAPDNDRATALKFANENLYGRPSDRVTLREQDRTPLDDAAAGDAYRLTLEALFESGNRGRLATWRFDVRRLAGPGADGSAGGWRIENQRALSSFDNLYRLALDPQHEFPAHDLLVQAEDLQLKLASGSVFVAGTDQGTTALVLVGNGEMIFSPAAPSERGQIKIVSGQETLRTAFDACFVRVNPADLDRLVSGRGDTAGRPTDSPGRGDSVLQRAAERVDARLLGRAQAVFGEDAPRSYTLDLADLSPGSWSILPSEGDVLAEIHTRRFGTLTYTRSMHDAEAIGLFDRSHHRYFALYAAKGQLASRGRFYSEDDRADYTVLHYDVAATFAPTREWVEGRTRMVLRVRAPSLSTFEVRLADPLVVRSVASESAGRLLAVRVRGQDALMVTLPDPLPEGTVLALTVAYGGRLPQAAEPEATAVQGWSIFPQPASQSIRIAPSYLYSARSAWYAQSPREDYATATLRLTVPAPYRCVASGTLVSTATVASADPSAPPATQFVFDTPRPLRYLACLISQMNQVKKETIPPSVQLTVYANAGEQGRALQVATQADDIVRFYTSLLGDCPYPDLTVALIERELPGGHSPAYLAILHEQVAMSRLVWREDPASFPGFPEYFVAHEIAHQWWGQAIGEKNYHETWLSEAFAQYFAALYAEHAHGHDEFAAIVRQMQRWTVRDSSQGPVYLGARVGQLNNDGRALRAVVYDKGALVLHMLRRLIGDEVFFRGLRLFYTTWRFDKAGSDDLRKAFEEASGKPLGRFFDAWIYNDTLPRLKFSWREAHATTGDEIDLRVEQVGDVFDLPLTVTIEYADDRTMDVVVPVTDRVVERRIPNSGRVRGVAVNRDDVVPAQISR